jgi:hypothetical protein
MIQIPVQLAQFPEVAEIQEIVSAGLAPNAIVEAILSPLSTETRAILRSHLEELEERFNLLTEILSFDDMELVLICELPSVELLMSFSTTVLCGHS